MPYDIVKEMEEVEGKEDRFDVSLVVGLGRGSVGRQIDRTGHKGDTEL